MKRPAKRKSKSNTVDVHFAVRCVQRLGYVPDTKELIKGIQLGKMEFYDKQSNRVTRWLWTDPINKIECILPYDKERKQLITILFKDINERKDIRVEEEI